LTRKTASGPAECDRRISRDLARFVAASRWEDLPLPTRRAALRSVLNIVGTALAGSGDEGCRRMGAALLPFAGPGEATLIGRAERADPLSAAFLNAAAANVHDFDDTHPPTIIHPSAPVAPPLFALASRIPLGGAELLHAFALGAEIECRLGLALSPGHYERGWHVTATCGVFGAAAACGKALVLGEEELLAAFGHAAAQSCGLVETLGSMAKSVGVGQSARGGLLAAALAREGVKGPERPVEGERGVLAVMGMPGEPWRLTEGLGDRWEIATNTFKPYPCGVVLNPVIEACLALRAAYGVQAEQVEEVVASGHSLLRQRTDRPCPADGRQAQVSAQHAVAVALIDGKAGLEEFSDARAADAEVRALGARVKVTEREGVPIEGAEVAIRLASGQTLAHSVAAAKGGPGRPLSDEDLTVKFRALAAFGAPGLDPEPLIAALLDLERAPDADAVIRLAALP
jgi:2-methylcitrate dehydratase PrpD